MLKNLLTASPSRLRFEARRHETCSEQVQSKARLRKPGHSENEKASRDGRLFIAFCNQKLAVDMLKYFYLIHRRFPYADL